MIFYGGLDFCRPFNLKITLKTFVGIFFEKTLLLRGYNGKRAKNWVGQFEFLPSTIHFLVIFTFYPKAGGLFRQKCPKMFFVLFVR